MSEEFMFLPVAMLNQHTETAIRQCNEFTVKNGLILSEPEIAQLVESRKNALEKSGRIEFGGGVIQKIIMEFADSPYINQDDYAETLIELQEYFYYFKNEVLDLISDDELIHKMKKYYDDVCQGSLDYLKSTMLENYSRDLRYGTNQYEKIDGYEDNYEEFLKKD
ncbi:MAG: DUF6323 family protein [Mobilitalea sp.]